MTYFYEDMKNFMIVYVTSMSSVVVWRKPLYKNFQALSPNFQHIEQNEVYIKPEEENHDENDEYVEPRIDIKLSDWFKVTAEDQEVKNLPAKSLMQTMIPKKIEDFIQKVKV